MSNVLLCYKDIQSIINNINLTLRDKLDNAIGVIKEKYPSFPSKNIIQLYSIMNKGEKIINNYYFFIWCYIILVKNKEINDKKMDIFIKNISKYFNGKIKAGDRCIQFYKIYMFSIKNYLIIDFKKFNNITDNFIIKKI
jgi:hypothetical protein